MDGAAAMAPPPKRRKLADSNSDSTSFSDNSTASPENLPAYAHAVDPVPTPSTLGPPWTTASSGDTEQPTQVPQPAVGGIQDFKVLLPRQGTLLNSVDSVAQSVLSSVTSYLSTAESISISISASASIPTDIIPTDGPTITDTAVSSSSTTTTTSSSFSETSSSNSSSSSTISSPISNDTSSSVTASTSSSTTGLTSFPGNTTTSALVSASSSRTTSTRTGSTSSAPASTDSSTLYLATLSNGFVTTLSRNSSAYTTTFSDGEIFTIPGLSTSSTRSSSRTTTGSAIVTTTVVETTSVSVSSSDFEPSTITSIATIGGAAPTYTEPAASSTTSSAGDDGGNSSSTPPAGTIAGGVVGGAAGLAVVVLIAMLFIRWYRRKGQAGSRALPPGSVDSPDGDGAPDTSRGPGMAERAGLMPVMASLPAFFRHQNRSTEGSSERGFTRVSGRKLPSAFSEGMSSDAMGTSGMSTRQPPLQMPLRSPGPDSDPHERSFYRDSEGWYGGPGDATLSTSPNSPGSDVPIRTSGPELMTMSPGPERQPQIHAGGPYVMSPTNSDVPTSATFDRSDTPSTLRNSRFTEDM